MGIGFGQPAGMSVFLNGNKLALQPWRLDRPLVTKMRRGLEEATKSVAKTVVMTWVPETFTSYDLLNNSRVPRDSFFALPLMSSNDAPVEKSH